MGRATQQRISDPDQAQVETGDLLRQLRREILVNLEIHLPCTVTAYNPATEQATVTAGWLKVIRDLSSQLPNAEIPQPPDILTIPVAWPDNNDGDGYRFPIIPQTTTGTIRVYDRSMATWMASPVGVPVDPLMAFVHKLHDSVFIPDIRPDAVVKVPVTNPAAHVVRAKTQLQLGGDLAVEAVTKSLSLQTFLIAAAGTAGAAAVPNDGGAAAFAAFATALAGLDSSSGSAKVKVEP